MKVGIMQPYFLPYIGYWQLMNAVDKYVVYDDVNYIKRGWINRNRILAENSTQYINIQIKGASQNKKINETKLDREQKFIERTLRTVEGVYKKAPYFGCVFPLAEQILSYEEDDLVRFLLHSFSVICEYLDIQTELILSSGLEKDNQLKGEDKILDICERLGADTYYNAVGGRELYSRERFSGKGIELYFLQTGDIQYRQFGDEFHENLSILDVMMFNGKEEIKEMLFNYRLMNE